MSDPRRGPPPLAPFGLILRHDGSWRHAGQPILNRKLREHFDRSVRYLPREGRDAGEGKYVVMLRHFRGEIGVEEAGFFVRSVDLEAAAVALSDGFRDRLDVASLRLSPIDGALLCRVKRELVPEGLLARFTHAAQAELLAAVEEREGRVGVCVGGEWTRMPDLE